MKEMYSFDDRGGEAITLRPEATAGICRALVSNGLTQSLPQKVFCAGPMFRYERPQKGRYRQFHQIDIELIGSAEPLADAEVIACGWHILQALGVADATVLEINTLGDKESRQPTARPWSPISPNTRPPCRRTAWRGWTATRCASSTARMTPTAASSPTPQPSRLSDRGRRRHSTRGCRRTWTNSACPSGKTTHSARPRLLRPHRVRIRHHQTRRAGHGDGRRAVRWPGGGNGRPTDPAVGWAAGIERLAMLLDTPPPAPATVAVVPIGDNAEAARSSVLQ